MSLQFQFLVFKRSRAIITSITLSAVLLVVILAIWVLDDLQSFGDQLKHHVLLPPVGVTPPASIPKKLWYKLGPNGLSNDTREWTDDCIRSNPEYEVGFMTDASADDYVVNNFGDTNHELVEMFLGLPVPIFKADLLRYLLLFREGGVYCDLDVSCEAPIDEWVPTTYKNNASLVVGWEFDVGWGDSFIRQFTTWTIMAEPGSPHVWRVIDDVLQGLQDTMAEKNVTFGELTREVVGDVVDATGPRRFTRSLLHSMEEHFNTTLADLEELTAPKLVGDILVLPGYAFAASSNRYGADVEVPPPLVRHHYAGTWKNEKGGEAM